MPPPPELNLSNASGESSITQSDDTPQHAEQHDSKGHTDEHQVASHEQKDQAADRGVNNLAKNIQDVHLTDSNKDRENSSTTISHTNGALRREASFDDDHTHLSNSSTKLTSLDSKSMASVATFALDEKESLRPDDSASVQAIDEEESLSGPASAAPNSVMGSEIGARGTRDSAQKPRQLVLFSTAPSVNDTGTQANGTAPRDPGINGSHVGLNSGAIQGGQTLHSFPQEPDQKLVEAMKTPKDRLLILQLEEKITNFIKHSQ